MIIKGYSEIPGQNDGLPKLTNRLTLTGCQIGKGFYTPVNRTIVFFYTAGYNKVPLTIEQFGPKIGSCNLYASQPFLSDELFEMVW